ncbi:MAG: hypothetical protein V1769_06215 [Thermoplasmatota archaeon]
MKAVCLVSSGIDSPVASYMVSPYIEDMILLHADTGNFSSSNKGTTFLSLARRLKEIVSCPIHVGIVPHGNTLQAFMDLENPKFTCVFCKRMMVRYADCIARQKNADVIVMGDSLGQVASQTLQNIRVVDVVSKMPIIRPLIGFDKQEIVQIARKIGTYYLSIVDVGECLAVPKKPSTQARMERLDDMEKKIDVEGLLAYAVSHTVWNEI